MREKKSMVVFIVLAILTSFLIQTPINEAQTLPSLTSPAKLIPFSNIGPTAPIIVSSNQCFIGNLLENYKIYGAYIWKVKEKDGNLLVYNYSLILRRLDDVNLEICLPIGVDEGVYDLELIGEATYTVPRSVWVLNEIPNVIRVVVMSDLHFGTGPDITYYGDLNRYTAAILANSLNPTLIIWTGDITESGAEVQTQLAQSYRYMMLYKYPVLSVPGNHDYPGGTYRRYLGPTRWVRVLGDKLLIIGVYTVPYDSERNIITWDEIQFLEEALSNYSYIPYKIVAFHYPMFYYQGELTTRYDDEEFLVPYAPGVNTPVSSYWSGNITAFRYVLKLIEDYGVNIVLAGHVHVDQYVKYTSTRTQTTTYFITMTTTAHGTRTYQGVTCFDLNLETGEIVFPVKPPGFIGFENSTAKFSRNSIPVVYFSSKLIKTAYSYKIATSNQATWYDLNVSTVIALPWSAEFTDIRILTNTTGGQAESRVISTKLVSNNLFAYIRLYNPFKTNSTVILAGVEDKIPPVITLRRYIPETPVINRSFTLLIEIYDDEWGLDFDNIIVRSNITGIKTRLSPETITLDLNKIALTISMTYTRSEPGRVYVEVIAIDNFGHTSTKKYIITFYPPGVTPTEPVIVEYEEVTQTETETPTPTLTLTPTPTQPSTPTETPTSNLTTETERPSYVQIGPMTIMLLIIIGGIILIIYILYTKRGK